LPKKGESIVFNFKLHIRTLIAGLIFAVLAGCMANPFAPSVSLDDQSALLSDNKTQDVPVNGDYSALLQYSKTDAAAVREAKAELAAAESGVEVSKGQRGPGLAGTAATYHLGSLNQMASLEVRQPVWHGGRLSLSVRRSELKAELAKTELKAAQNMSAHRFVSVYFQWLQSITEQKTRESYLVQASDVLNKIEREYRDGLVGQSEFLKAQIQVDQLRRRVLVAQSSRQNALVALESFLLAPQNEDLLYQKRPNVLLSVPRNMSIAQAVANDPTVIAAYKFVEITKSDIELHKLDGRPKIDGVIKREWNSLGSAADGVGLTVNFTLSNPKLSKAQTNVLKNTLQANIAAVDIARADLMTNITQAERLFASGTERMQTLSNIMLRANDALASAQRQKRAGNGSWETVITAITELSELKVSFDQARLSAAEAAEHLRFYFGN
jgi:outer membrane protein, adhesin transport system